jgi:hypothetical protein
MDCHAARALAAQAVTGALEGLVLAEYETHCTCCKSCERNLVELRLLEKKVDQLPPILPRFRGFNSETDQMESIT